MAERDQLHRHWQGAQRFQRLLMRLLWSPTLDVATRRLDQLIRVAAQASNPHVQKMSAFLDQHRAGLLVFYACLESGQHRLQRLQRLSRSQQTWVSLTKRWAMPITSNAAEHVFRFAFYHNMRVLRAGKRAGCSLLAAAHTDVKKLFGTDDA
ncbi:MAG: hypothetical protein MAG451_01575 [Anaerolineales bacterium]|nr:hypothetical protein [Anaerolineales bacterium]